MAENTGGGKPGTNCLPGENSEAKAAAVHGGNKVPGAKPARGFREKLRFLWRDKRRFSARLATALPASFAFAFGFFVYGPFEIYFSNMQFFAFAPRYMTKPVILGGLTVFAVLALVLCLLRGRIYDYAVSLVFSLSAAGCLQSYVLNRFADHGALDGTPVIWQDFRAAALLGLLFWAVLIILPAALRYFSRRLWKGTVILLSAIMAAWQIAALITILCTTPSINVSDDGFFTKDTIYEVSPGKNTIVFILDRFDKRYADEQFAKDPKLKEMFRGFTFYDNFTGSYSRTCPSLTYLLTGRYYDYETPIDDYFRDAWSGKNILGDIRQAGYETKLYTDVKYVVGNSGNVAEEVVNVGAPTHAADPGKILSALYGLSAYRYMPEALKPYFHICTGDISYDYIYGGEGSDEIYAVDDAVFFRELREKGISVKEGADGSFIFYHLKASHGPYDMDENGERRTFYNASEGRFRQTKGDLNMIKEYLNLLREKGVFDCTTVVITADHGETGRITKLNHPRLPALFIKPAFAKDAPMLRSHKQVCQDNLRASILSYFGLDYSCYGCRTVEEIGEDEELVRYFWMSSGKKKRDTELVTYEIRGDANDLANYTEKSRVKIACPYYK